MKKDKRKVGYNAMTSSQGSASIDMFLSGGEFSKFDKERALAGVIAIITKKMYETGYIRFMSPQDISDEYGKSRQYWEKLLREGKIPYQQTSSGKITTNLWVEGYLNTKNADNYGKEVVEMRRRILENEKIKNHSEIVKCARCGEDFSYYFNQGHHINGICKCGFHIHTQE